MAQMMQTMQMMQQQMMQMQNAQAPRQISVKNGADAAAQELQTLRLS